MMKKVAACILILAFVAGCTGSFKVTRAVYHFHRSQKEKAVDELLFLGCVILPIYGIATLADAVILNSIEFWTGRNPMVSNVDSQNTIVQNAKNAVSMSYNASKDTISVTPLNGKDGTIVLSRTNEGVSIKDLSGKVLFTSVEDDRGGVTVLDSNKKVVKYFRPDEVEKGRVELFQN